MYVSLENREDIYKKYNSVENIKSNLLNGLPWMLYLTM